MKEALIPGDSTGVVAGPPAQGRGPIILGPNPNFADPTNATCGTEAAQSPCTKSGGTDVRIGLSPTARQTVTLTASSSAGHTKTASAAIAQLDPVVLTVTPGTISLSASQTQQFTVTVTGGTGNTAVTWSLNPNVGTISRTGLYTAPGGITERRTVTLTATSSADPTITASAEITLLAPVVVTVRPRTSSLSAGQMQQFTATVRGGTGNTAVTWSLNPNVGTISRTGLYTAPANVAARQTITLTATSSADPTKTASATITLLAPVVVTVTPTTSSLSAGQTQQFYVSVTGTNDARITWSLNPNLGSITTEGEYTAPAQISTSQTVILTATSVVDPAALARATITLNASTTARIVISSVVTTPTQAILSYSAPDTRLCSLIVSEHPDYSVLVPDINPALFSNQDDRPGNIVIGRTRIFVVGKRAAEMAQDQRRYSRALQPNTMHYFTISCGQVQAAGTFATSNLPSGATYPEPPYSDRAIPGILAFPTVDMNKGFVTDPQSGLLMTPVVFNIGNGWPASSSTLVCQPNQVVSSDGVAGYACIIPNNVNVLFVDTANLAVRLVGDLPVIFGDLGGDGFDVQPLSPNNSYSTSQSALLTMVYTYPGNPGGFPVILSGSYAGTWQAGDLSFTWRNLTPHSSGNDLLARMKQFDNSFDTTLFNNGVMVGMTPDGNNIMVAFLASRVTQGTVGWLGMFDYLGNIIAAMPVWRGSTTRWCTLHAQGVLSNDTDVFTPSGGRYMGGWPQDSGLNGDGPWISYTSASILSDKPTFIPGATISGSGFVGLKCPTTPWQGCDVVTVLGQPIDPTPGPNEANNSTQAGHSGYHLMDMAVGDRVQAVTTPSSCENNICENMMVIGVVANGDGTYNVALARGGPDYTCLGCNGLVQDHPGLSAISFTCECNFMGSQAVWNFGKDPHGTGSNVTPEIYGLSHAGATPNSEAGQPDWFNCPSQATDCLGIKIGADGAWAEVFPSPLSPGFPGFAGVPTIPIDPSVYVEHYTTPAPANPVVSNPNFYLDMRPFESVPTTFAPTNTPNIYLIGGVGSVDTKRAVLFGSDGGAVMLDVSSPTTSSGGPVPSLTTPHTFCIANQPSECFAGSTTGGVYANVTNAVGDNTQTFMTIYSATEAKLSRHRFDDASQDGRTVQPLTTCGRLPSRQTGYASGRLTPDGQAAFCYADNVNASGNSVVMLVKLPPLQPMDGIDRTNFVPVSVNIPGRIGTTAIIAFGYAENGSTANHFCQPRQEECLTNNVGAIGNPPFSWASENPAGAPCSSGCQIVIPGISERIAYYQVRYSDGYTYDGVVSVP